MPTDVMALIAGGRHELLAMRRQNKHWQTAFDLSATTLRVGIHGPLLPVNSTFCQRFPSLLFLDLGEGPVGLADLFQLSGFKHLRAVNLGWNIYSNPEADYSRSLFHKVDAAALHLLRGLQLEHLGLSWCYNITDQVCHESYMCSSCSKSEVIVKELLKSNKIQGVSLPALGFCTYNLVCFCFV